MVMTSASAIGDVAPEAQRPPHRRPGLPGAGLLEVGRMVTVRCEQS